METCVLPHPRGTARLLELCQLLSARTLMPGTLLRNELVASTAPAAEHIQEVPTRRLRRQAVYPGLKALDASPSRARICRPGDSQSALPLRAISKYTSLWTCFWITEFETTWPLWNDSTQNLYSPKAGSTLLALVRKNRAVLSAALQAFTSDGSPSPCGNSRGRIGSADNELLCLRWRARLCLLIASHEGLLGTQLP